MPREQVKADWPDGSTGPKRASFCITCGLTEVRPERTCFNEGKEAEFTDVAIIPAAAYTSLLTDLEAEVERLEADGMVSRERHARHLRALIDKHKGGGDRG